MKEVTIQEALDKGKGKISIRGWVYRERKQKDMVFLVIRDATNIIQSVVKKDNIDEKTWTDVNQLLIESSNY